MPLPSSLSLPVITAIQKLVRETRMCQHPNIPKILNCRTEDTNIIIVYDKVYGKQHEALGYSHAV